MWSRYFKIFVQTSAKLKEIWKNKISLWVKTIHLKLGSRGLPKLMLSDNGKTFKADQLKAFNTRNGIIWRFNLAKAPWWGGLFERLTHSTKRCLRTCVRNCTLTYEEFYTVLVEIEGVLNSRPLTYLDENDIEEPLKPIHLYCGHRILKSYRRRGVWEWSWFQEGTNWNKYSNLFGSNGEKTIY